MLHNVNDDAAACVADAQCAFCPNTAGSLSAGTCSWIYNYESLATCGTLLHETSDNGVPLTRFEPRSPFESEWGVVPLPREAVLSISFSSPVTLYFDNVYENLLYSRAFSRTRRIDPLNAQWLPGPPDVFVSVLAFVTAADGVAHDTSSALYKSLRTSALADPDSMNAYATVNSIR